MLCSASPRMHQTLMGMTKGTTQQPTWILLSMPVFGYRDSSVIYVKISINNIYFYFGQKVTFHRNFVYDDSRKRLQVFVTAAAPTACNVFVGIVPTNTLAIDVFRRNMKKNNLLGLLSTQNLCLEHKKNSTNFHMKNAIL